MFNDLNILESWIIHMRAYIYVNLYLTKRFMIIVSCILLRDSVYATCLNTCLYKFFLCYSSSMRSIKLKSFLLKQKMAKGNYQKKKNTCKGRCGGPPIPWWYITSCFNCDVICECAWLFWCFCISTAANASALLRRPSFNPEKISPWKIKQLKWWLIGILAEMWDWWRVRTRESSKSDRGKLAHSIRSTQLFRI